MINVGKIQPCTNNDANHNGVYMMIVEKGTKKVRDRDNGETVKVHTHPRVEPRVALGESEAGVSRSKGDKF